MSLSPGTRLGAYEVVAALGKGGMGEVFRARDTRLGREVAIKVLPAGDAARADRRARFAREARAVAALNHPNICTLHDVGEHDGHDFLVMELLHGETLAARLSRASGSLPVREALEIGAAIAAALAAAHDAGFVHRDLKPANVMLTPHGVKVLDFGLARVLAAPAIDAMTVTDAHTSAGIVLGTLPYMAPEQVEGHATDARTDIFALGAVLYELLTGVRPFQGDSTARLTAAILTSDPTPLTERAPLTPTAIDRLVRKCLSKAPAARWQSARDVADELRWIASTLTHPSGGSGSAAGTPSGTESAGTAFANAGPPLPASGAQSGRTSPGSAGGHGSTSGLGLSVPPSRPGRRLALAALAAAAIAGVVFGTRHWTELRSTEPASQAATQATPTVGTQARHTQVTFDGNVQEVALSPDGQSIAYTAALGNGMTGIFVRDVAGGQPLELGRHAWVAWPQWAPDGTQVLAASNDDETAGVSLISVPRFGGAARRLASECGLFAMSPDGALIACVNDRFATASLRVLDSEGNERRRVPLPALRFLHQFVWVDDRRLAVSITTTNDQSAILEVPLDGSPSVLTSGGSESFAAIASVTDRGSIYATRKRGSAVDLVRVSVDRSGAVDTLITGLPDGNVTFAEAALSLSRGGRRLAHVRGTPASNLWVLDGRAAPRLLTRGSMPLASPSVSADGRVLVASTFGTAKPTFVRVDEAGTTAPITDGLGADVSPDGSRLAFVSDRGGRPSVWVSSADGTNAREVQGSTGANNVWWASPSRIAWQLAGRDGFAIHDVQSGNTEIMRPQFAGVRWWVRLHEALGGTRASLVGNGPGGPQLLQADLTLQNIRRVRSVNGMSVFGWVDGMPRFASSWTDGRIFQMPTNAGGADTVVATLPGRILNCAAANPRRYIVCAVDESRSDAWIIDDFDPQVSSPPQ